MREKPTHGVLRLVLADRPQELFRKVRSILNKLTPQKFNQLMKQVTDLTIDTEERLKGVIDLVFEKAIDEPSFSVAYGNMCRCLATVKSVKKLRLRMKMGVTFFFITSQISKLPYRKCNGSITISVI